MDLQEKLDRLQSLANSQGAYLNEINFCPAGVGFQWWEEQRYDEEAPSHVGSVPEKLTSERAEAGLVVYHYYDSLTEAVDAEMNRLLDELDES